MRIPARLKRQRGRHALVDGIPFELPVDSRDTPALMAVFTIDAARAAELLPGAEIHPLRVSRRRALLVISVIDYKTTDIGSYIEFSIAIACTHGRRPAPPLLPALLRRLYGTGQYVLDLPVSTEVSVKGGKGIWGMPKHQASLDFQIRDKTVSSRYDLDGELAVRVEVDRPRREGLPVAAAAVNYCAFRGMLMKSYIHFRGRGGVNRPFSRSARLEIGEQQRVGALKSLDVAERPLLSGFLPQTHGTLDDHYEGWFLFYDEPPTEAPEGLESVVGLSQSQEWPPPPGRSGAADPEPVAER